MKRGQDISVQFKGLYLVHHNLPEKKVTRHAHTEHILFIPLQGTIAIHLDQSVLKAGTGNMVYLPPETFHAFDSSDNQGERIIALFDTGGSH